MRDSPKTMAEADLPNLYSSPKLFSFSIRTLLVLIAIAAFAIASLIWLKSWLDPFAGRYFNQDLWHQYHDDDDPNNPRASMVSDLRWRYLRTGMTRAEVENLLGIPDFEKRDDLYSYNLGMWSGFRIDYDSLDIHFDTTGKLIDVRRVQH